MAISPRWRAADYLTREFRARPAIMRHDRGLAASPRVRYRLKLEGRGWLRADSPARRRLPSTAFMPGLPHSNSAILAPIGLRRLSVSVMRIFRDTTVFGERHCQVN